ncbi:hypothetical protein V5P93_002409 [Actinokineospora auranticolor]|uniref:hypothetical protein n=1 Tax=Actinokineospora auranticolor TaxID=155976 RepID=UPI001FE7CF13|nr:hypothetical protein [Actinokineospora auranticolor]
MTAAAVLGVPLASYLGSLVGWRAALGGVAVPAAVALLLVRALLPRTGRGTRPSIVA